MEEHEGEHQGGDQVRSLLGREPQQGQWDGYVVISLSVIFLKMIAGI